MEIIQHTFFKFCMSKFRHSNHQIGSLIRSPARIIPYPTGRLFWMAAVPGTSCQATIIPSLRDKPLWGRRALRVLPRDKSLVWSLDILNRISGRCAESCQSDGRGRIQKINEFARLSLHFEPELADNIQTRGTFGISAPFGQRQIGL